MPEITMPRLSDTMEEGVIVTWRKRVGDEVRRGDVVAEIETDKALMELEAYDDGVLERLLVAEGDRTPIGTPIAIIGDGTGATAGPEPGPKPERTPGPEPESLSPQEASTTPAPANGDRCGAEVARRRPKASPLARKIAREHGIELTAVEGSGPGGRIIRKDVEAAITAATSATTTATTAPAPVAEPAVADPVPGAATSAPSTADYEEIPLTTIQRVAARRLTESKQQAPHFYLTAAVDVTDLLAFRATLNDTLAASGGPKISLNDLVVRAVAVALRADPSVNVSFAGDRVLRHRGVHLGVAVAVPDGLVVPVVRDADRKSVSEIAEETREKAGRARDGRLRADELTGGTFTISNLGMFGIEQFAAVINPPEAAILAVGAASEELRLVGGEVVTRSILRVTLSADHRAVDGATGATFLRRLRDLLENPLRIVV
ncbi:dihydrolipoamide acetyltransferase family protein [Saccharomonospora xinjiangensis]|uniref:Dihydrolipoamide acetyltransferase component of pyruvate dehydrogenase complex n=1 Tax=Saccharomonospora xinjiangensis XJ-54 TaxID=882086 RepID=I0V807_9PSEU|nr:dihydrolipoamide acetyltransferase family protein [Saccharomonospora xinjiangensis]EID56260.1 pyruvate/2-oxoglutarate dehydrogenase complex, dihydrolipoamide acyltransferase component [Saccharomonospora xinjiangensis XJ-54]